VAGLSSYTPGTGFLFFAFYDTEGCGGGILTRLLHKRDYSNHWAV
jgi:hypothetical protein